MKKVVIALDSFKGCLTSLEAARAAARGVSLFSPTCKTLLVPMADGGEGTLEALQSVVRAAWREVEVHDPLMRPLKARYLYAPQTGCAYLEMAAASGLPLVPPSLRNPLHTSTYGTGEMIADALKQGCRHLYIGLGGSATNDGGTGMLQALGVRFTDASGHSLCLPGEAMTGAKLLDIEKIDTSGLHPALAHTRVTAACDVRNPFHGPRGAACVFAPQKGADKERVLLLDKGLQRMARLVMQQTAIDLQQQPGAGAAGGLGGALTAFLHATLTPGIEWLLQAVEFDRLLEGTDLVLTGEGKADRQTLMGKVPQGILEAAKKRSVPVALLAGQTEDEPLLLRAGFHTVTCITPPSQPLEVALQPHTAQENLTRAVRSILEKAERGGTAALHGKANPETNHADHP